MPAEIKKSKKMIYGKVVSSLMKGVAVIEIVRTKSHPLYGKQYKVSKKIKAKIGSEKVEIDDMVYISETRPASRDTHFEIVKVEEK